MFSLFIGIKITEQWERNFVEASLSSIILIKGSMSERSGGLHLLTKLSYVEHVNLTSWSRMRVDLATQVYSFSYMLLQ